LDTGWTQDGDKRCDPATDNGRREWRIGAGQSTFPQVSASTPYRPDQFYDVVARFGDAAEAPLREVVAGALVNKGVALGALGRSEEAIAVHDDVVARFGDAAEAPPAGDR
jgi:hypothetical protein